MRTLTLKHILLGSAITLTSIIVTWWYIRRTPPTQSFIKVGILHSLTGPMTISEKPIVNAALMAIDEINESGGILGKKLVPIVADGASDWPTFAQKAEKLITQEQVAVIFGCWTSASRKMVKPIVEKHNNLLFYAVQYEGLEKSPNIVYTGSVPNQQVIPAVTWCLQHLGKRIFVVGSFLAGSDTTFQRVTHEIIKDLLFSRNATLVGSEYISSTQPDMTPIINKIIETKPDVIINTINGETNKTFFKALRDNNISSEKLPTMSLSITELELTFFDINEMIGDYATQGYFQSLNTLKNKQFVKEFKKKYGKNSVISGPMESTYAGVYLWRNAVIRAKSTATDLVRAELSQEALDSPEGIIYIDKKTQHTWKLILIGKIFPNKQFGIIWNSINTIQPLPYSFFKTQKEWETFLALSPTEENKQ